MKEKTGSGWEKLFAEWEGDYAARRAEDARPLPSPGDIARETRPHVPGGGTEKDTGNGR